MRLASSWSSWGKCKGRNRSISSSSPNYSKGSERSSSQPNDRTVRWSSNVKGTARPITSCAKDCWSLPQRTQPCLIATSHCWVKTAKCEKNLVRVPKAPMSRPVRISASKTITDRLKRPVTRSCWNFPKRCSSCRLRSRNSSRSLRSIALRIHRIVRSLSVPRWRFCALPNSRLGWSRKAITSSRSWGCCRWSSRKVSQDVEL